MIVEGGWCDGGGGGGGGGGVLFQVAALRQISLAGLTASYLCVQRGRAGWQAGAVSSSSQ